MRGGLAARRHTNSQKIPRNPGFRVGSFWLSFRKGQGLDRVRAWSQTDRAIICGLENVYVAEQRDEGV